MKALERFAARKLLVLVVFIIVALIAVLLIKYSSDSKGPNYPPAQPPDSTKKVTREKAHEETITLQGYVSWISCGDGCDAYGFTDQNNKTWTISRPDRSYDTYINKHQLVKAQVKVLDETTLDILKIE